MTTPTILRLAFRCNKCWQLTCADSDQVGQSVPCVCCATPLVVPEATADLLKAGEEFVTTETEPGVQIDFDNQLTPQQIYEMARDKVKQEAKESGSLEALVCSRWKRFLGSFIDSFCGMVACILGVIVFAVMGGAEGGPSVLVAAATIPLMLGICQLYMTAVEGRTIGKYCVKSKIVRLDGSPPGFFQGIILRIVAIGFLGMIPFFGLLNAIWIFMNDSNRCIHDLLAGTLVIDA